MFGEKITFGGANLKRSFFDDTEVFGFWMVPACSSKVWCFEWNGILSIPQLCEERITHVSTLKTFPEKVRNWNGINSQLNGVNFQPNGVIFLGCFQCIFGLWHATYLPMFSRVCDYQTSAKNARIAADSARIPPNSWNGSFWLRTAEISEATEATIISLAWAGRRNFTRQA